MKNTIIKKTMASLMLSSVVLFASANKDSEGMYHLDAGNGPSVAEAVSNTTGGTAYTGLPGNTTSSVSKDSEALYQHNSGRYTKTITATFVPQPPDIIKTTWKTIYKDRIVYRYKDCGTGGTGGGSDTKLPDFELRWRVDSGRWTSDGKTYYRAGFIFRVFDATVLKIYRTPSRTGQGIYYGASGGIGFPDRSYLRWGSVWRGGTGGNKRSWYFLYGRG